MLSFKALMLLAATPGVVTCNLTDPLGYVGVESTWESELKTSENYRVTLESATVHFTQIEIISQNGLDFGVSSEPVPLSAPLFSLLHVPSAPMGQRRVYDTLLGVRVEPGDQGDPSDPSGRAALEMTFQVQVADGSVVQGQLALPLSAGQGKELALPAPVYVEGDKDYPFIISFDPSGLLDGIDFNAIACPEGPCGDFFIGPVEHPELMPILEKNLFEAFTGVRIWEP
jgi:hypothetical protein